MARSYEGAHDGAVLALAFDEAGTTLYSSGADGRVLAWPIAKVMRAKELAKKKAAFSLAWWNGELHQSHTKGTRLVATKSRLLAIGDRDAKQVAPPKGKTWKLPAGETTDATADDARIVVVKDADIFTLEAAGKKVEWKRKRDAGTAFVRFDAKGRVAIISQGSYSLGLADPKTGRLKAEDRSRPRQLDGGAQGGPIAIDPSGRYLVVLHQGRVLEMWDLEILQCMFAVSLDVEVTNEEALAGLHRVPKFEAVAGGLKRVGSKKPPVIASEIDRVAVANGGTRIALGSTAGGIVLVDTESCELRTTTEILEPARARKLGAFGTIDFAVHAHGRTFATTETGRLLTFDTVKGACVGDVVLEGYDYEFSPTQIVPFENGVRIAGGGQVDSWSFDGKKLGKVDGFPDWITTRVVYAFDWDRASIKKGVPLVATDATTGKRSEKWMAAPKGFKSEYSSWGSVTRLGTRASFDFHGRGSVFFDPITAKLGKGVDFNVLGVAVDDAEEHVIVENDDAWRVIRLADGKVMHAPKKVANREGSFRAYDYEAKSGRVVGHDGRSGRLNVWTNTGKLIAALPGEVHVKIAVFAPGGKSLFTLNKAGIARLWDVLK